MSDEVKIELTAEEWMDLINTEGDSLEMCCANVSALRDCIVQIAREDGILESWNAGLLMQRYAWVINDHEGYLDSPILQKLMKQVAAFVGKELPTPDEDHEPAAIEVQGPDELVVLLKELLHRLRTP